MRIISLRSENFKRLTAVSITPDGSLVEITGRNGQGKSSVIDSIWATLGGAEALPPIPVREGADEAIITLDLGEMKVTRKIKRKEDATFTTSLVIEMADGTRPKSPQSMLNDLVGRFSMDPMEFSRLQPKAQFDALKLLVPGLDLDEIAKLDEADYERRTVENRRAKEAAAAASAILVKAGKAEPVDEKPILNDIARASDFNKAIEERKSRRDKAAKDAEDHEKTAAGNREKIAAMAKEIAMLQEVSEQLDGTAAALRAKLASAPPLDEPLDTGKLSEALVAARAANAEAQNQARRNELLATSENHESASAALTAAIKAREEQKNAAIAAAKFPVDGLSLGSNEVLVNGLPFSQAATSHKIRTSVALAMAMNPTIRVLRIMDGSLLDKDAMALVADMAKENDYQVWVETVSDGSGSGIIIEDGHIKES